MFCFTFLSFCLLLLIFLFAWSVELHQQKSPEGRPGMYDVPPLSEISGLSFDSSFLSPLSFFCQVLLLSLSCHFSANGPTFFSPDNSLIFVCYELGFFCMALVEQLGDDSWKVLCAACCHVVLVFSVMHLFNISYCLLFLSIPFLYFSLIWYR